MSTSSKWVVAGVLAVLGVVAAVVAVEYLTVPIHELPSFIPGGHPGRGTYHKRGAISALFALVLLGGAVALAVSARSGGGAGRNAGEPDGADATGAGEPAGTGEDAGDPGAPADESAADPAGLTSD